MTDPILKASFSRRRSGQFRWVLLPTSLALLGWVLWRANLNELLNYLRRADYPLILLAVPVSLLALLLRAIRWRVLLLPLGSPSIKLSFNSLMLGYLGNNFLPMRAGEVLRAYVLGRESSISKSAVFATIMVERIVDGMLMILVLSWMFAVVPMPSWLRLAVVFGGIVFFGTMGALIIARKKAQRCVDMCRALFSYLPARWQPNGTSLVDNFILGLTSFRGSRDAIIFFLLTLTIWGAEVFWFRLMMHAFGIWLSFLPTALAVAAVAISTTIPALPGYVGTYEFVLVTVVTLFGVLVAPATAFAVTIHGVTWIIINLVGTVCAFQLGVSLRTGYELNLDRA